MQQGNASPPHTTTLTPHTSDMKILHILDHSLPLHSGYTFRSQNIFRSQRSMGFDPVILTSPKHEESLKKQTPEKEQINGFTYYRTGPTARSALPVISELALMRALYQRIIQVADMETRTSSMPTPRCSTTSTTRS
jgi:hypothetical protein